MTSPMKVPLLKFVILPTGPSGKMPIVVVEDVVFTALGIGLFIAPEEHDLFGEDQITT